jgi:hypothetical protein
MIIFQSRLYTFNRRQLRLEILDAVKGPTLYSEVIFYLSIPSL